MKTDARVRYTRMRIQEAFYTCLAQKPVDKITVKELCEMAEINRATFYKHYADPFDLLEKLEQETLDELRRAIAAPNNEDTVLVTAVLGAHGERQSRCALLASDHGDPRFSIRMAQLLYQRFFASIAKSLPHCSQEEQAAAYEFVTGGSGNLLARWLQDGMQTPVETLAARISAFSDAFLTGYAQQKA